MRRDCQPNRPLTRIGFYLFPQPTTTTPLLRWLFHRFFPAFFADLTPFHPASSLFLPGSFLVLHRSFAVCFIVSSLFFIALSLFFPGLLPVLSYCPGPPSFPAAASLRTIACSRSHTRRRLRTCSRSPPVCTPAPSACTPAIAGRAAGGLAPVASVPARPGLLAGCSPILSLIHSLGLSELLR